MGLLFTGQTEERARVMIVKNFKSNNSSVQGSNQQVLVLKSDNITVVDAAGNTVVRVEVDLAAGELEFEMGIMPDNSGFRFTVVKGVSVTPDSAAAARWVPGGTCDGGVSYSNGAVPRSLKFYRPLSGTSGDGVRWIFNTEVPPVNLAVVIKRP